MALPDGAWRARAIDVLDELEGRPRRPLIEPDPTSCPGCERLRILVTRARAEPAAATRHLDQALA